MFDDKSANASGNTLPGLHNSKDLTADTLASRLRDLRPMAIRLQMLLLLVLGVLAMIAHHEFNRKLNHVEVGEGDIPSLALQLLASPIGSAISVFAKTVLTAAMGMVFVQLFWLRMRRSQHSIAQIDSAMGCKDQPFGWAARNSWRYMFWLTVIPALAFGSQQIIVVSTGSIVPNTVPKNGTCSTFRHTKIFTVDLSNSSLATVEPSSPSGSHDSYSFTYISPIAQTHAFVAQVIMAEQGFLPYMSKKAEEFDKISYDVYFNAPALSCVDITSSFNFSAFDPSDDGIVVWDASYLLTSEASSLVVAARQLVLLDSNGDVAPNGTIEAVNCTFYNANYQVNIARDHLDISVTVTNKTLQNVLANTTAEGIAQTNHNALADSLGRLLNGTAVYDLDVFDFTPSSPIIVYSPLAETVDNPFSLSGDLTAILPNLMDLVSTSLLSGALSESGAKTLEIADSAFCEITQLVFVYNPLRLLLSYGASLLVTAVCIGIGFYAIHVNGVEETLDFSRILRSVVNEGLLQQKGVLGNDKTLLKAHKDNVGEMRVMAIYEI